jgi:hypothetical protein
MNRASRCCGEREHAAKTNIPADNKQIVRLGARKTLLHMAEIH